MSISEKLSTEISLLSDTEQTKLLYELIVKMNLVHVGISHTKDVCGGRACVRDTRIPVWLIIEAKQAGASDISLLQDFPSLSAEDLTNAQRYYLGHKEEIESDLQNQSTEA